MRISEFSSIENNLDTDERELRANEFEHFKDAASYSVNHHNHLDIDMKEKNLDYIIAKAEEKRKAYTSDKARVHEEEHAEQNQGFVFQNR